MLDGEQLKLRRQKANKSYFGEILKSLTKNMTIHYYSCHYMIKML